MGMSWIKKVAIGIATSLTVMAAGMSPAAASTPVTRIMPLGDSITRGIGQEYCADSDPQLCKGYRVPLHNHLVTAARPKGFKWTWVGPVNDQPAPGFDHAGNGGWTIDRIAENVGEWQRRYRPDVIILHAGTNNITSAESGPVVAEKLRLLLVRIRTNQPSVRVFVGRIIPVNTAWVRPTESKNNRDYANRVSSVVTALGGSGNKLYTFDARMIGQESLFDAHHPNNFGYRKMAYQIYESMRGVLPGSNRWGSVSNPSEWKKYEICHYYKGVGRRCSIQPVNDNHY